MSEELEPCPFECGAEITPYGESWITHQFNIDCPLSGQHAPLYLWNRRAKPALSAEQRAALEALLSGITQRHQRETIRAMLDGSDEAKGGDASDPDARTVAATEGAGVAGAASTAPPDSHASGDKGPVGQTRFDSFPVAPGAGAAGPDSPAKIAAEMREKAAHPGKWGKIAPGFAIGWAARVEALGATHDAEVDQFNAGFDHAKSGGAYDPPSFYPNDQDTWGCGYAWWQWLNREALGLEPSEREVVRGLMEGLDHHEWALRGGMDGGELRHTGANFIAAVIAALTPIVERKEGT